MKIEIESTINNKIIRVCAAHTLFVNVNNIELIPETEFKSILKQLKKKFKESKTRFYSKNATELLKRYNIYQEEVQKYNSLFGEIKTLWKGIVKAGIYAPTIDNVEIKRAAKIRADLESMLYRSSIISKFINLKYEMERCLKNDSNYAFVRL